MNTRFKRIAALIIGGTLLTSTLVACSEIAPPDQVGLYYDEGNIDGYHFDHCYKPGSTTDAEWNNSTVLLPNSLRTWNVAAKDGPGVDSTTPITVNAAPEDGQPSGVQVNLWTQTNFMLNTYCGADDKDANSPLVQWWEKIGRRYQADTTNGWSDMLGATVVTAEQTAARSVAREYTADVLVSGTKREEVQAKIADLFATEIKRLTGGEYYCSPTFDRNKPTCGAPEVQLKDVDYTNPAIQQARDEKQAAIEHATALVAAAQGQVDAANKIGSLYNNPNWVQLQQAQLHLQEVQACAANPNCTVVISGSGDVITSTKK